jgi:hypothetical protein
MNSWQLVLATFLGLVAGLSPAASQPKPGPDVLRRVGETTVFSFVTSSGKTVSLCEGPQSAYLVYRFGTAAKTALQYPTVLDASSWQKFTYWSYHRGGGVANAGEELHQLSFKNGGVEYQLYDDTHAFMNKAKEEDYRREAGVYVVLKGKEVRVVGKEPSVVGSLYLADEQRERVKVSEQP